MIPDSVAEIGANAFADNKIRTLDIPATVEYPGKGSFKYNYINTLTLHGGIEVIEDRAFYNNYFGEVKIPNTAEYLGRYSFGYKDGKSSDGNYRTIEKINDFKIIGIDYSKADTYAEANGFKFESATTSRTPGDSSSSEPEEVVYDSFIEVHIRYKEDFVSGDVNGDGTIDIEDAVSIINHVNGVSVIKQTV